MVTDSSGRVTTIAGSHTLRRRAAGGGGSGGRGRHQPSVTLSATGGHPGAGGRGAATVRSHRGRGSGKLHGRILQGFRAGVVSPGGGGSRGRGGDGGTGHGRVLRGWRRWWRRRWRGRRRRWSRRSG